MATSRALAYLESAKNLAGCAGGLVGLVLTFTGVAGAYWPVVIAGLYGAGALIAPPGRPEAPAFEAPAEQLEALRADFATLSAYLAKVDLPPAAGGRLTELNTVLASLLEPGWVAEALADDPEAIRSLSRAIRQDVPESVDTFVRTRWWTRLQPGTDPPERHLERQLTLLYDEACATATVLREVEARRQETHTRYLEERRRGR
ncbi:hypothetical protein QR77_26330 [Streptomyces sp. 150FB]|uniref:hypothetical protein n=1 Tax=Streptomyces sp. 150FB TaxID=1576605 RepID=UPI0005892889|nr:hypothetical protein [Streptomyces sp. 150FB]KIF76441.1 hypothetical protein QR77_26330 [Streptomyces sp. 150FB]